MRTNISTTRGNALFRALFVAVSVFVAQIVSAQLKTHSTYDVNGDGTVNITDVTAVVNKVLGKVTDEQMLIESKGLSAWIENIENYFEIKVDDHSSIVTRMNVIDEKLRSIRECTNNGHKYVDLGLPSGLKWATCNVGADQPEKCGDSFAWGATKPQEVYDWTHTPFQTQNTTEYKSTRFTKYLGSITSPYKDPSATDTDALKTVLDPEDDAAHVNWGGDWRMPTKEEIDELLKNCYWQWVTSYNGVSVGGYVVYKIKDSADKGKHSGKGSPVGSYSVSDPHIFLPLTGVSSGGTPSGFYWSSTTLGDVIADDAYFLLLNSSTSVFRNYDFRYCGYYVRAVCP